MILSTFDYSYEKNDDKNMQFLSFDLLGFLCGQGKNIGFFSILDVFFIKQHSKDFSFTALLIPSYLELRLEDERGWGFCDTGT